jgi:hypothetical protein
VEWFKVILPFYKCVKIEEYGRKSVLVLAEVLELRKEANAVKLRYLIG